jgi:hypothetical protein
VEEYRAELYGSSILHPRKSKQDYADMYGDSVNTYQHNSHGYRSGEFKAGTEILFAGCSFTYGIGVPEETIWGNLVADKLEVSRSSIAVPGESIQSIVTQLFQYFATYGDPKTLLCLFPDLYRINYPIEGEIVGSKIRGPHFETLYTNVNEQDNKDIKIVKRPFDVAAVISTDLAAYVSVSYIRILEQYCSATGINLLWSSWADNDNLEEINADTPFRNYLSLATEDINDPDCHSELREKYGSDNFHSGTDIKHGVEHAHPGIHSQVHFAEGFLASLW